MSLVETERATYDELLASVEEYRAYSPGLTYLPVFLSLATIKRPVSVLDAGCCTGKVGVALEQDGWTVTLADLTDAGLVDEAKRLPFQRVSLWNDLRSVGTFDYTYCCDVLEHIPTAFTMLVVDQLLRVTRTGLFLGIALTPDHFGVWAGKPLHQTVQSFTWWRDALRELGTVWDARDLQQNALFFVGPKL
jgi:SAM-dependent methyltransferase